MADYLHIPSGWRFAAPQFSKGPAYRTRKKGIHPAYSEVVGVLIWNHSSGEADVLLHPAWTPTGDAGRNLRILDLVETSARTLDAHADYAGQLEKEQDGKKQ